MSLIKGLAALALVSLASCGVVHGASLQLPDKSQEVAQLLTAFPAFGQGDTQAARLRNSFLAARHTAQQLARTDPRWGILRKTSGSNVDGFSADYLAYCLGTPSEQGCAGQALHVDIIADAEGADGPPRPSWAPHGPVDEPRISWAYAGRPEEPAPGPPGPQPQPQPIDLSAVLQKLDALAQQVTQLQHQLTALQPQMQQAAQESLNAATRALTILDLLRQPPGPPNLTGVRFKGRNWAGTVISTYCPEPCR